MSQSEAYPPPPDRSQPLTEAQRQELRAWGLTYARQAFPNAPDTAREQIAEQLVDAIDWTQRKWGQNHPCPYCGNQSWEVGPPVELLTEPVVSTQRFAAKLEPLYPVSCTNCGQTTLVRVRSPKL
jgi:predicted RNA-binding Zn-ribbon protein involved in translation (DUF1610 family)